MPAAADAVGADAVDKEAHVGTLQGLSGVVERVMVAVSM